MDDATKKMLVTVGAGLIRKVMMLQGLALVSHGVISSNNVETFVSIGMALAGAAWSLWNDFGRAIVLSKLEVWKAKSLAQAAALHANGIPPVTNVEIAAHGPEALTPAGVAKVTATLCLLLAFGLMVGPAFAQRADDAVRTAAAKPVPRPGIKLPFDPLGLNKDDTGTGDATTLQKTLLQSLAKPFQMISAMIGDDVDNAILLSTAVPGIQDGHGQQCWIALRNFTAVAKAHPLPLTGQIATDLQAIRLQAIAANQLCSNIHCTQMFTDYSAMAQAVAQGAVGLIGQIQAKAVPTLADACHLIPQISLVDPIIPAPPAPVINPVGWAGEQPAVTPPATPPQ